MQDRHPDEPHDTPSWSIAPVARVRGARATHQDDHWGAEESVIELEEGWDAEVFAGLDAFSHLEILYRFDQLCDEDACTGARHPRNNSSWPVVGIFAQRARKRPNLIGLSRCALIAVEGRRLRVRGLDALDGTPVLDIKPLMRETLPREPVRQPAWSEALMRDYYADATDPAGDPNA